MFKILIVIVSLVIASFSLIALLGFFSAWVVSRKKSDKNYSGPTNTSGVAFWFIIHFVKVLNKVQRFFSRK